MNEMYNMSIVTHNYGVFFVLGVILVNFIFIVTAKDIKKYVRAMRLFNPTKLDWKYSNVIRKFFF